MNPGVIAAIVIVCVLGAAIVVLAICCFATAGPKHGKVDSKFTENDDVNFVSMSVL